MIKIPDSVFKKYYEFADEMIDNVHIGVNCFVYYPPRKVVDNSLSSNLNGNTTNKSIHGGPSPFQQNNYSGQNNVKEIQDKESIRLRVYHDQKSWKKISNINVDDADVMIIGYLADLKKIIKMESIKLTDNNNLDHRYTLAKEPFPHGFGKNRYFIAFLKKK